MRGYCRYSFALDDPAALAAQVGTLASKTEGFAVLDAAVEEPMKTAIRAAGAEGDSVGGVLETAILGLPAGTGEPYFDSVESEIAHLAFPSRRSRASSSAPGSVLPGCAARRQTMPSA